MSRSVLVIVLIVLIVSGCSSSRQTVRSDVRDRTAVARDSVRVEQVMVAEHDTIMETTTITVRENEAGDTVWMTTVTDRDRVRDRSRADRATYRTMVKTDTVYVEKRDSVLVKNEEKARASPFEKSLKWIFWIVIALIGLIILCRAKRP